MTKKIKINFSYLIIFFGISCALFSQVIDRKLEKIPVIIPSCAFQDSSGFIWIGTQEGLIRYDGYETKSYKQIPFDSTSLSNNFILNIKGDKKGNLWIATNGGGLNYFNQKTEKFSCYLHEPNAQNSLGGNTIEKIIVNDDGSLWLDVFQKGLTNISWDSLGNPTFTQYMNTETTPSQLNNIVELSDIYEDRKGNLWFCQGLGLEKLDPTTGDRKIYKHNPNNPNSINNNWVSSICEDTLGNLWLATGFLPFSSGTGLAKFNQETEQFIHYRRNPNNPNSFGSDTIASVFIDSDNIMWIGAYNKGIQKIPVQELIENNNPQFRYVEKLEYLPHCSFYEDNQKYIWICVDRSYSIGKYDKQQNRFPRGLYNLTIESIFIDSRENIWFGHFTEGLTKYDNKTTRHKYFKHELENLNSLSENRVSSICEDSEGNIWLATPHNGIDIFNPTNNTFKHIRANPKDSNALYSNHVDWLLPSKTGDIWIALNKVGLQLFDFNKKQFIRFDVDPNTKEDEYILSLYEDRYGTLWIGTQNNGLYGIKLENKYITSSKHFLYDPKDTNGLTSNMVCDIIQPQNYETSALWIATNNGLNRLDLKTKIFTHIQEKDGINSNYIVKILEANNGNLWFTTSAGLTRYNPRTGKIRNYGKEDGLPTTQFITGSQCTAKDKDGRLYFAGNGVIVFDPEKIKNNKFIPPIRLSDFKILNESTKLDTVIHFKRKITLSHEQNVFSFEFTALNFTNASQNQYTYRLEGFDKDWIYTDASNRIANYTNIDPGEYVFRVKGSNNDGVWNEEGTSIKVIILPPWWATWWFRAIASVILILIGYLIYRYRVNQLLQLERMRVQIASDLHDDVGSSLTKIAIHSEIIQNTKDKNKVTTSSVKIGSMSREIISSLSDIIWSIDARNDKVGDLVDRMRDYLDTVFPAGSVTTNFQTYGLIFENTISQELRQNIYLIFKEAVNNAAKYSDASEVKIKMTNGSGIFRLEINDDGKGINLNEKKSGNHGLENMKLRAERIGGEFKVENKDGTLITLIVKEL